MRGGARSLALGVLGITLLIVSIPMALEGHEPFVTWFYPITWYGLILFLDSVRAATGKPSLIFTKPLVFAALVFWSAVVWFLFEAFNLRLANWYYIFASDGRVERILGCWLSFGTVLPALFLLEKLLEDLGLFRRGPPFPMAFTERRVKVLALLGLACMALPVAFPGHAYPLVWVFGFLLPLPFIWKGVDCPLLADLEAGRAGGLMRTLAAGLVCGVIWEFLNHFARIRWIYTVPFFEDLKWFEMPPLGFLGFPVFAVECVVIYALLVRLGIAPELEGICRRRERGAPRRLPAAAAGGIGLCMGFLVLHGMERYTIDSFTPRPEGMMLEAPVKALVERSGVKDCFQLRGALENPVIREELRKDGVSVEPLIDRIELVLLRGIGTEQGAALAGVGVDSVARLAEREPDELAAALAKGADPRAEGIRRARVRVWIKAAKERQR